MISLVCLILALVFFVLVAVSYPQPAKLNFMGAGLVFFVLSFIVGRL